MLRDSRYRALSEWSSNTFVVTTGSNSISDLVKANAITAGFWILHFPCALVLSIPTLLFIATQNISSQNAFVDIFSEATVVVAFNLALSTVLLKLFARLLVKLWYYHNHHNYHELRYNVRVAETQFVLRFLSDVIYPVVLQVVLGSRACPQLLGL